MRIYNEIVIDMNPDSLSYGETLHEDSFEYEGDLMLMQNVDDKSTKLARKGRYGDTEIRNVAGRKSHVNKKESNLIDLYGMLGERLVRDIGAGTINPKTGLPEYHYNTFHGDGDWPLHRHRQTPEEKKAAFEKQQLAGAGDRFDKGAYANYLAIGKGDQYLRNIGIPEDRLKYFESNIDIKGNLELAEEAKTLSEEAATLTETQAEAQYGIEGETYRGAQTAFDIGTKGLAEGKRGAEAQYGLGMEQAGLQTGRSLFGVKEQADVETAKSGFATQGTITSRTKGAQKGIFQDYTAQQKQLAEARTSAMTRFGLQGEELTESLRSAEAGADIAYAGAMGGADLDRKQADLTYKQKKQQIGQQAADEWWETYEAQNV